MFDSLPKNISEYKKTWNTNKSWSNSCQWNLCLKTTITNVKFATIETPVWRYYKLIWTCFCEMETIRHCMGLARKSIYDTNLSAFMRVPFFRTSFMQHLRGEKVYSYNEIYWAKIVRFSSATKSYISFILKFFSNFNYSRLIIKTNKKPDKIYCIEIARGYGPQRTRSKTSIWNCSNFLKHYNSRWKYAWPANSIPFHKSFFLCQRWCVRAFLCTLWQRRTQGGRVTDCAVPGWCRCVNEHEVKEMSM